MNNKLLAALVIVMLPLASPAEGTGALSEDLVAAVESLPKHLRAVKLAQLDLIVEREQQGYVMMEAYMAWLESLEALLLNVSCRDTSP